MMLTFIELIYPQMPHFALPFYPLYYVRIKLATFPFLIQKRLQRKGVFLGPYLYPFPCFLQNYLFSFIIESKIELFLIVL